MTGWKTLCRELVTAIESNCKEHVINHDLNCAYMKADTALSQPEPEGPTDSQLDELFVEIDQSGESESWRLFARAVLARWGK